MPANASPGTAYHVTFERVGRDHNLVADFTAADSDDLAEQVWRFARGHLGSKWFEVDVDLGTMTGRIESGRFGRFTIAEPQP